MLWPFFRAMRASRRCAGAAEKLHVDPSNRAGYRHTGALKSQLISRRSHMTKLFPFARVVTPGFWGLWPCLFACTRKHPHSRRVGSR